MKLVIGIKSFKVKKLLTIINMHDIKLNLFSYEEKK